MIVAIIPAGGSSSRYKTSSNANQSKLFEPIHNTPVIEHSINAFIKLENIHHVIVSCQKNDKEKLDALATKHNKKLSVTIGGKTRAESVLNAFKLIPTSCSKVLIHDAARPNPSPNLIQTVIESLNNHPVIIPAIPITDTIKKVNGETIDKTLDRTHLRGAQTPQGFNYNTLSNAYKTNNNFESFTDESSLLESIGINGQIIPGELENIKVTIPLDLTILSTLMTYPV